MKIYCFIAIFLLPVALIAQEKHSGLTVGLSISKFNGDDLAMAKTLADEMNMQSGFSGFSFNSESRTGISMGIFIDYPVYKSISIQPEISYTQKGTKFSGTGSYSYYSDSYTVTSKMVYQWDYLDFTLLGKFTFTQGKNKPYVLAGPGFGYLVSSRLKVNVSVEGESESDSSKIDADQKTDVNLNFGAGIDFSNQIRLDFRYSTGLIPVLDVGDDYKLMNSVISINLVACF